MKIFLLDLKEKSSAYCWQEPYWQSHILEDLP